MAELIALRRLVAARLVQARELRRVSQRALGDLLGLGKTTGATRVNRYEREAKSVSLAAIEALAEKLRVPPAYLLADSPDIAEVLLALSEASPDRRAALTRLLLHAAKSPELLEGFEHIARMAGLDMLDNE